jgi:hypothetical protein
MSPLSTAEQLSGYVQTPLFTTVSEIIIQTNFTKMLNLYDSKAMERYAS